MTAGSDIGTGLFFEEVSRPVIGVSGGVDSMTLLHLSVRAGLQPVAAHVNYGLRGADSDEDERLVRSACDHLGVACRVLVDPPPKSGESTQIWARRIRYDWFERVAREMDSGVVAVAHHRDDQAETILINLMRGTGIDGLTGMDVVRPFGTEGGLELVRPLLGCGRATIRRWAEQHDVAWREDASNADPGYLRTHAREVARGGSLVTELVAVAGRIRTFLDSGVDPLLPLPLREAAASGYRKLDIDALLTLPSAVRARCFLRALSVAAPGFPLRTSTVEALEHLLHAEPGRWIEHDGWRIWRDRNVLRVCPEQPDLQDVPVVIGRDAIHGSGILSSTVVPVITPFADSDDMVATVDADRIEGNLILRTWRPGDRFTPLGGPGSRKVKDFLTDRRVPPSEKKNVRVLCLGTDIVWVVGHRLDEAFGMRGDSSRAVRFRWEARD